ncbi:MULTISPECIES: DUF1329 domain-containing protein [unclassified Pseudomonas]|uniref:DUF1329 domain-containing protein n=1 Tax=unclassified Pseudomonas TaxID=196821 RepID=UPI000883696F|nr:MULTISPECIES: DUF1329 domain-containing protein [unclassified Pseudomonas]SCZ05937.1 Protein of unknown function [Pseudomonas sp. NFACC37-1]SFO82457.1 Protein of unknown function [Pseudomonas sp. NFACC24-1]
MNKNKMALLLLFPLCMASGAYAAVSPEQAKQLGTTLTPVGAEMAGNADGTIPKWTGGYQQKPAGHQPGSFSPLPFPDEKLKFQITAANADQYKPKLSDSVYYMLKNYPGYQVDVYDTHRTASAPQWFYDYAAKNAVSASSAKDGLAIENAYGGTPFPIPKTGSEVLWNHFLSWKGTAVDTVYRLYMADGSGRRSLTSVIDINEFYRYSLPGGEKDFDGWWWWHRAKTTAPGRSAGEALIGLFPSDYEAHQPGSWQYMPGQRRVRKLPNVQFDTPNFYISGLAQFDESYGFFGSPEQYNWKLVTKREMYIPYNTNALLASDPEKTLGANFVDPSVVRWELHRVWEVEGILKDGKRNAAPKRKVYMDEDSWNIVASDLYDAQGKLWRGGIGYTAVSYDLPGVVTLPYQSLDFQQRAYTVAGYVKNYTPVEPRPRSYFTAEALTQDALR